MLFPRCASVPLGFRGRTRIRKSKAGMGFQSWVGSGFVFFTLSFVSGKNSSAGYEVIE